jgi:hypothetical protein
MDSAAASAVAIFGLLCLVGNCQPAAAATAEPTLVHIRGKVVSSDAGNNHGSAAFPLPHANVSLLRECDGCTCAPSSQRAGSDGAFALTCVGSGIVVLHSWARQYVPQNVTFEITPGVGTVPVNVPVRLEPRAIPGFPASRWRFDGWVVQAETRDVPTTNISFLSHPSAYRTPSGRIFMISTAGSRKGQKPGWTQGYWQSSDGVSAEACGGGPLIDATHPGVVGVSMSARLVYANGRLLMVSGIEKPTQHRMVTILENKNVHDPCHSEDWVGVGTVHVNFTGAPTSAHEDYRLHVFEDDDSARFSYTCNGAPRKFWLLVIPDGEPGVPGRACGRMAFAADALTGPYVWCNWAVSPNHTACQAFPGDVLLNRREKKMYFVESYGALFAGKAVGPWPLAFPTMLPQRLVVPSPRGEWDDLGHVALTFLPASYGDTRTRLYFASYSTVSENPNATKADFGYKLAIGQFSFQWDDEPASR